MRGPETVTLTPLRSPGAEAAASPDAAPPPPASPSPPGASPRLSPCASASGQPTGASAHGFPRRDGIPAPTSPRSQSKTRPNTLLPSRASHSTTGGSIPGSASAIRRCRSGSISGLTPCSTRKE
jgi:hypothetical protein